MLGLRPRFSVCLRSCRIRPGPALYAAGLASQPASRHRGDRHEPDHPVQDGDDHLEPGLDGVLHDAARAGRLLDGLERDAAHALRPIFERSMKELNFSLAGREGKVDALLAALQDRPQERGLEAPDRSRLVGGDHQRGILKDVLQPGIYYLNPRMVKVSIVPIAVYSGDNTTTVRPKYSGMSHAPIRPMSW